MPRDKTVADLNMLYRQARSGRSKLEPEWYLNLAFYSGKQWVAWNGSQLFTPNMGQNRVTITDNRIRPAIRKEIAKMTKMRPVFAVTPTSADEEDSNAASLGEKLMDYFWEHLNMDPLRRKALLWSRICGSGFMKTFWDPTLGDKRTLVLGPDGKPLVGDNQRPIDAGSQEHQMANMVAGQYGQPSPTTKQIAQGDIVVETRSPFQIFPDPLADTFEECEWLIEENVKSAEYISRRYKQDLNPDTPANPGLVYASLGGSMGGSQSYKGVKVREYWCKPNSDWPNGYRAVWAVTGDGGSKKPKLAMLEQDDKPFDPMPFVMFSGIPVPGQLFPSSVVDDARGPQTDLNKLKSQLRENGNRIGNPTIMASKQAVQDPNLFARAVAKPGAIVQFDDVGSPNAVPTILQAPPMPEYVSDGIQQAEESLQEIFGQHDVSSASVPPGVTAASAINLLQEADDTMIAPDMADHEMQLAALGEKILCLAGKYYTDTRTIQIGGDNANWEIFDFRGQELKGNYNVKVQAGSAFPQSKSARQAQMQDLMNFFAQAGVPMEGRKLAQFLQDSQVGGAEKLVQDFEIDDAQANRENVLLMQCEPLPINPYDNDQAHLENHENFEKAAAFAQADDQCKQIHLQHTDQHRQRLAQQQQQEMAQQMQAQGTPPPEQQQADAQQQQQGTADQQEAQAMQAAQGIQGQAQQQGYSNAQSEQAQRHAEQAHQQQLSHKQQMHEQQMKLAQMKASAQNQRASAPQPTRSQPNGR